ncbi:hypothetical protein X777_06127, partial [Ooceraea biroi]
KCAESPLARANREKVVTVQEDNGKCTEGFSKGSTSFLGQKEGLAAEAARDSISQDGSEFLQDEVMRRRELALRQHAFFQLRLHIRRGTNLVAMDRCGKMELYTGCPILYLSVKYFDTTSFQRKMFQTKVVWFEGGKMMIFSI